jgi:enamine deaminase RidA (YjgF/YER057c/UK114 family)
MVVMITFAAETPETRACFQELEVDMKIEQQLKDLGLSLPEQGTAAGTYVPAVQVDKLLFVSGHTGSRAHDLRGKLGRDLTVDQGYEAARHTMLACLASLKQSLGDLDRVKRIVKLLGFINAADGFTDTPKVLNGASDLLVQLYGKNGQHARSAIGVAALPGNAPVEVEMIVEIA